MTAPKAKRYPRCGQVKPANAFYRRRQDPASTELLRAVDRTRQRRRRALRYQPPLGGGRMTETPIELRGVEQ